MLSIGMHAVLLCCCFVLTSVRQLHTYDGRWTCLFLACVAPATGGHSPALRHILTSTEQKRVHMFPLDSPAARVGCCGRHLSA
jgi:hypothetical protein